MSAATPLTTEARSSFRDPNGRHLPDRGERASRFEKPSSTIEKHPCSVHQRCGQIAAPLARLRHELTESAVIADLQPEFSRATLRRGSAPLICWKDHPRRPPSWRWLRAVALGEHEEYASAQVDDPEIVAAFRFQNVLVSCSSRAERRELAETHTAMYRAYQLWEEHRWPDVAIVEARILAGESLETIGAKTGRSVEALRWYLSWFYDVEDRLQGEDWVANCLIGDVECASGSVQQEQMLKKYAYFGGPVVLDSLLYTISGARPPQISAETADYLNRNPSVVESCRAAVWAETVPLDMRALKACLQFLVIPGGHAKRETNERIGRNAEANRAPRSEREGDQSQSSEQQGIDKSGVTDERISMKMAS